MKLEHRVNDEVLAGIGCLAGSDEWSQGHDLSSWPDARLLAAVRRDPPDTVAVDALAYRYWRPLFGRCYLLTLDRDQASDLAQRAWARVLQAHTTLLPDEDFLAYLTVIATNLWREAHPPAVPVDPISEETLNSLDEPLLVDDADQAALTDVLPHLNSLSAQEQTQLKLDIDRALARLAPHLREMLIARFVAGESCAEIGLRRGHTEQTVDDWLRKAIRQMKQPLAESSASTATTAA
jgi:RNA polymerase sigma factor (sigma-70 family)